jgi:hypothetical protein
MPSAHGRTFDRLPEFDERSRAFPIRSLLASARPRSYTWACDVVLDQGAEGACVGFGWAHELAARPVVAAFVTNELARLIYREAQRVDEWPGEAPAYEGTSVLAGAKTARLLGHIPEYRWAFGLDDLKLAVGYAGPAVIGVNWYEGMIEPDRGMITPSGSIVGGHCVAVVGISMSRQDFTILNSWGAGWGSNGRTRISWSDMERLLDEQGEACIPVLRQ